MDEELARAALEEARRSYDEQGELHAKTHEQITIWLTIAGLVLAALAVLVPATFSSFPASMPASFRALGVVVCATTFAGAVVHLRRFFFGRDLRILGSAKQWVGYVKSLVGRSDGSIVFMTQLTGYYAEAADHRRVENTRYLAEQLNAKRWIAIASIAVIWAGFWHLVDPVTKTPIDATTKTK